MESNELLGQSFAEEIENLVANLINKIKWVRFTKLQKQNS